MAVGAVVLASHACRNVSGTTVDDRNPARPCIDLICRKRRDFGSGVYGMMQDFYDQP